MRVVTLLRFGVYSVAYLYDMIPGRECDIELANEFERILVGVLASTRQAPKKYHHIFIHEIRVLRVDESTLRQAKQENRSWGVSSMGASPLYGLDFEVQ